MTDVVVTGVGAVSHAGASVAALWDAMVAARPAPRPVADRGLTDPRVYLAPRPAGAPAGATGLLVAAADEALREACVPDDGRRVGVVVGTGMGDSGARERHRAHPDGPAPQGPVFGVADDLARHARVDGPAVSVSNACAASAYAVAEAVDMLASGECDVVLAGGAESYSRVAIGCFERMGALDGASCRPFAADRGGTLFGEGAAVLVLERADDAVARGARAVARVRGYGRSCDADHPTAPSADGAQARRALVEALRDAGVAPGEVALVVPHGTGTAHNDDVESRVLADVLGEASPRVPLYSLKALLGHTGGAAGALATVAAVEVLRRRRVPGNVPVGALDAACRVHLPLGDATPLAGRVAVVNAYAFGGNNVSLVLEAA